MNTIHLEWRERIEHRLKRKLTEPQWEGIALGFGNDLEEGDVTVSEVVEYVREQIGVWGADSGDPEIRPDFLEDEEDAGPTSLPGDREIALSRVYAAEAAEHPYVVHFREDVLEGQLIVFEEVEGWVQRVQRDEPHSTWLNDLLLPEGAEIRHVGNLFAYVDPPIEISEENPTRFGLNTRSLAYGTPTSRFTKRVLTRTDGVLDLLRIASEALAKMYRWDEAAATVFVLTGRTPIIPHMRVNHHFRGDRPALSRITLTIDPSLSGNEVKERYGRLREEMIGDRRHRRMSLKKLELAAFYAECGDDDSWRDRMARWNARWEEAKPEWHFTDADKMGRECRAAIQTLCNPSILDGGPVSFGGVRLETHPRNRR